ncbi:hypothetical protein A6A29_39785 [Streptomyces sp. TSRI0281]|nr:hypothetical protein A6A29_39785 [Streptomyces sp. TSRI0281]
MHRPVLQQGQDRRAYVTTPRPSPAATPPAPATEGATAEGTATERRPELPEGRPPPLEVAPTRVTGPTVPVSMSVLMLVSM